MESGEAIERSIHAVIAAVLGFLIAMGLYYWIAIPGWGFIAIPAGCLAIGFLYGERAINILKHVLWWT